MNRIPTKSLNLDDLACLAECKARLLYTALERAPCLREITRIAAELEARGHVSSIVGRLHLGLGAVACCEGRYAYAKTEFRRVHEIFTSLGNDNYGASGAAQIGLCCFRLGEYEEAIHWGSQASKCFGPHFSGYTECLTALSVGCSCAIRGDAKGATNVIRALDMRLQPTTAAWMLQAWGLYRADILFLLGQHSEAFATGRKAIGNPPLLFSSFFAGSFSRWLALLSETTAEVVRHREHVSRMTIELHKFDAIDQVEIMCAAAVLARQPESRTPRDPLLREKLMELPLTICDQLHRLGMLV